jgi:hypothetical protein
MTPKYPWDSGETFSHGCVLIDPTDGLYKAWYLSTPQGTKDRQCTYAVSEDGVNWDRPELDVYPCDGYDKTNIILGSKMGGKLGQLSVVIHPDAPPDQRYELFCFRDPCYWVWKTPGYGCPDKRIEGVPLPPGYDHHLYGMYRHFSADGIHWKTQSEPIAGDVRTSEAYGGRPIVSADGLSIFQLHDGRYVMHNKVELAAIPGGYVAHDIGAGGCRTIARRESDDGQHWSVTYQNILTPDWRDPADTQFMELGCNQYNNGFIGMATVYHAHEGTIDLQLAGSAVGGNARAAGRLWQRYAVADARLCHRWRQGAHLLCRYTRAARRPLLKEEQRHHVLRRMGPRNLGPGTHVGFGATYRQRPASACHNAPACVWG